MKKIIGIGFSIPSQEGDFIHLDSNSSLSDVDIAILSLDFTYTNYSTLEGSNYSSGSYEGKRLYNKASSARILENCKYWKAELAHFLNIGGTLVIILDKIEDFFVYTGTKNISGTGRNQQVTNHVQPFKNYNFLPFQNIEFNPASGKTVLPNSPLVTNFYNNFKNYLKFETYIKGDTIQNLTFTTKNKDRILGTYMRVGKGYVHFIPCLDLDVKKFRRYDKNDDLHWNAEGIKIGKMLLNDLIEIDNALRKEKEKTPKPIWVGNKAYKLTDAETTAALIQQNNLEIERRQKENINLQSVLDEQESLKDLLFENGKPLENAVTKALSILGYKAENYDDGELELDQVIVSPEGHRLIGECEGKDNKDIDVSKFRQLLDSLNADFEREHVNEKAFGLIFGNPQRLIDPAERTLSFTKKCQTGAEREKIGLIKTASLFEVARYVDESKDQEFAKKCRTLIIEQLGKIVQFPPIPSQ